MGQQKKGWASTVEQRDFASFFKHVYSSVSKKQSENSSPTVASLKKSKSETNLRDLDKLKKIPKSSSRGVPTVSKESGTKGVPSGAEIASASSESDSPSSSSGSKYVGRSPETYDRLVGTRSVAGNFQQGSVPPSSVSPHKLQQSTSGLSNTSVLWKDDNGYNYARPEDFHQPPGGKAMLNRKVSMRASEELISPLAVGSNSVQTNTELKNSAFVKGRVSQELNSVVSDSNSSSSSTSRWRKLWRSSSVDATESLQSVGNTYGSATLKSTSSVAVCSSNRLQKRWSSASDLLESSSNSKSSVSPRGSYLTRHELPISNELQERQNEIHVAIELRNAQDAEVAGKQSRSLFKRTLSFGKKRLFPSTRSTSNLEKDCLDDPEKVKYPRVLSKSRSIDFDRNPVTKGLFKVLRKDKISGHSQNPSESTDVTEENHHRRRRSFDSLRGLLNTSQKRDAKMVARDELMKFSTETVTSMYGSRQEESRETFEDKRASKIEKMLVAQQERNAGADGREHIPSKVSSTCDASNSVYNEHITGLSPDLWRHVFSFLPRQQILGFLRAVCREWQAVIDSPLFIPHLKKYHTLDCSRTNSSLMQSAARVEKWIAESHLTTVAGLLSHLQRDPFTTSPTLLQSSLLRQYQTIHNDSTMLECWSNCITTLDVLSKEFDGNMWCLALILILFVSEGPVLQEVLNILLSGKAGACRVDALEFLHLILTAITASCWQDIRQPLSMLESSFSYAQFTQGKHSLQGGIHNFTAEQLEILNTDLTKDKIMVVQAFPGTGKTTTLLEYAKRRPGRTFGYLIFDRVITTEGEKAFAPNTKSISFQKLAYAKVGWQYRHKLQSSNLSAVLVKTVLGVSSHTAIYFILLTLEQFLRSRDLTLKHYHVPKRAADCTCDGASLEVSYCVNMADKLWGLMIDKGSREIPMTHNGYLKLYQLSEPRLDQFDCLLCDEVQNASPVMVDIVLSQAGCNKIFVGDPHQQIHGFTDEGDPLQKLKEEFSVFHFKLTLAFRFSPEIASTCNALLQLKEEKTSMIGVKSASNNNATVIGNVRSDLSFAGREKGAQKGQVTVVARTHAGVFEAALQCSPRKLGFVGGIKGYQLDLMRDTWYLMKGSHSKIQDLYVKSFVSFVNMIEVAEQTGDLELLARVKLVEAHKGDLSKKLDAIRAADVGTDLTSAEVIFSTAHKVKGLEFDVVALTNDYLELSPVKSVDGKFCIDGGMEQELNWLYVAASRAKTRLILNADLHNYISMHASGLRGEPRALLTYVKDAMSCTSCLKSCSSQLAIVAGRLSEHRNGVLDDNPLFHDDVLQCNPSSSRSHHDLRSWKICLCLNCARRQETVPTNLAPGVKMIASVFS